MSDTEAQTTPAPDTPAASKRKSTPNPERIRAVLETVSIERLDNERQIQRMQNAYRARDQTWAERLVPLRKTKAEADADLKAHDRYKHQMTPSEWADERRDILAGQTEAGKVLEKVQEECNTEMGKLMEPIRERLEKRQALKNEWEAHVRRAQKAGVDASDFWTPEMGIPTEEEVDAAAAAPDEAPPAPEATPAPAAG